MKLLIQGMRRSGTTILFDALSQDGRFDCWYEPFGPAKRGRRGGGSGVQDVEFAARTRALRERFCVEHPEIADPAYFNYGAPRDARLELQPELPEACRAYLRCMLDAAPDSVLKLVRASHKLAALRELVPDAFLVHVVRDPRRVAVSQVVGRERLERGLGADAFFALRDRDHGLWASRALSECLLQRDGSPAGAPLSDVERVLLVWGEGFRETCRGGLAHFGERYRLLRHEDLVSDTERVLDELYTWLGWTRPEGLLAWLRPRLRPLAPAPFAGAPGWQRAFRRLALEPDLREAGYGEALEQPVAAAGSAP